MSDIDRFITFLIDRLGAETISQVFQAAKELKRYLCPNCKTSMNKGTVPCPTCGTPLRW